MNQQESSISAGRASLFLLIPAIALIALSFGIRHFLDTTPGGGSGEFQGINHFAPSLILVIFCIPAILLISFVGSGLEFRDLSRVKPRNPNVIAATILHTVIVVGWLARFLGPLYEMFFQFFKFVLQ
jgi:hypothetical protein